VYLSLRDRPVTSPGDEDVDRSGRRLRRRRVSRVVVALGMVSLLTDVSSESVSAILPLYLTSVVGLSTVAYGFVDGLYQGVSAVVRIGAGMASDRTGHPKWVAVVGYGLSCVARVFLLFASGLGSITAVVTADRIGKGVRTAPRDAMIASVTPTRDLGRAFGVHRTLDTIGAAVGPLMAFAILWAIPTGYSTVMVASLGAAVAGVALLLLLVPDHCTGAPGHADGARRQRIRWREVADPRLTRLLVVVGALGLFTVGDGFVYLALLDRSQFAAQWFPLLYVGSNIAYLLLALPIGRLADRVGRARVLLGGHLALVAAYACAAVPLAGWWPTVLALASLGTFYAATDGVTAAVAGRLVAPEVRASGIAAAQTVVALARLLSSTGFGVLWLLLGPRAALLAVAVPLLLVMVAAVPVVLRLDRVADAR
jgi:MFS family permease